MPRIKDPKVRREWRHRFKADMRAFRHEMRARYRGQGYGRRFPVAPLVVAAVVLSLLLTGFFTFTAGGFFERGEASLASFFVWHPWLYLVLVPAVGMRLWSEERRAGTIELLLTSPITDAEIIIGKFLGAMGLYLGMLAATVVYFGLLLVYGHPRWPPPLCGLPSVTVRRRGLPAAAAGRLGSRGRWRPERRCVLPLSAG